MTTGVKRERETETDSKNETENVEIKENETNNDESGVEIKKDNVNKEEEDKNDKDKKDEKEPTSKKPKIDENANKDSPKKVFGGFTSTSSGFASYKSPFASLNSEKNVLSSTKSTFGNSFTSKTTFGSVSTGTSTSGKSFDSLLSEGKPFDTKEKIKEKNSQFKETESKTGEEDEETVHSVRAKLYEDENDTWKERGIGLLKINCNKENKNKVRLVMRAEGILRVILNERIIPGMKFSVIQDKYISFAAISDKKTFKKYLIKCGSTMGCNELYKALENVIPKE